MLEMLPLTFSERERDRREQVLVKSISLCLRDSSGCKGTCCPSDDLTSIPGSHTVEEEKYHQTVHLILIIIKNKEH